MKIPSEDSELQPLDPLLDLYFRLWKGKYSVNAITAKNELRVYPAPDNPMTEEILHHWNSLAHYLPGLCDSCDVWSMSRTEGYWGAHPHLCPDCLDGAIAYFEDKGSWPEANWYEGEG